MTEVGPTSVRQDRLQRRRAAQREIEPASEKAASYSRYSSDLQRSESNEDQQRVCREGAERNHHVISTDREFADAGVSGTRIDRAGLNAMLDAAERGEFSTLYLHSLSRLARESILTLPLLKKLVFKFKIRVISLSDGIDTSVTNWQLIAAIMSFFSEQYLRDLAANVLRGQEGIVLAMLCVGDYCFGYRSEPIPGSENTRRGRNSRPLKCYVLNETTCAWVDRIFYWFVVKRWSIRRIARVLTRLNVPKDHRSTNPVWRASNVRSILENEKYIGRWRWGIMKNVRDPETGEITQELRDEEETENWVRLFPKLRLVSDKRFEAAQQLLRENEEQSRKVRGEKGRLKGSTSDRRGQVLLSNLIECGECGSKFVCAGKRIYCPNHPLGRCSCSTGLKRNLAEHLILDQVTRILQESPEWLNELEAALAAACEECRDRFPTEEADLRRQLADVESRRDNLLRLLEEGENDPDVKRRLANRRGEARELRNRLQRIESQVTTKPSAPTRDEVVSHLQNLAELLRGSEAAAGDALRRLLGGRIVVREVKRTGAHHGFLRGTLSVRVYDVAQAIEYVEGMSDLGTSGAVSRVIDFIDPDVIDTENKLRERAWLLYSEGRLAKEIAAELDLNRNRVAKLLEEAAEARGERLVDGRSRRANLARKHLEPPLFQEIIPKVMERFDHGELYGSIAVALGVDINTVRKSVNWWHQSNGLKAPDGRSRRIQLEIKSRK